MPADLTFPPLYRLKDGPLEPLDGQTIAVLGYGRLGRPLALNLRETGRGRVIVGSRSDESAASALVDGFEVQTLADATGAADIALILLPDEVQPAVFAEEIAPRLKPGAMIIFASGYALAFGLIHPPPHIDVALLAPRMLGEGIRNRFLAGQGFFSYVNVEQEITGTAWKRLLAVAAATGCLNKAAIGMTARTEAVLDLFGEQAFGPWLGAAMLTAFHVGVEAGLPPVGLLLELYLSGEMSETLRAMAENGFLKSTEAHGYAAAYGGMVRSLPIDRSAIAESMREALADIASGQFAQSLQDEVSDGYPCRPFLTQMIESNDLLSQTEERLRRSLEKD